MIHLILGGARSGKSSFAEKLAREQGLPVIYTATATASDDEMKQRIENHQAQRPHHWELIEEPFNVSNVIEEYGTANRTLLIECMTLWVSNWLCTHDEQSWFDEKEALFNALNKTQANIIIVSNEVGSGVVPMGELSRSFVDQAGWLNQALAELSDRVTLVVAGCPLSLKDNVCNQ